MENKQRNKFNFQMEKPTDDHEVKWSFESEVHLSVKSQVRTAKTNISSSFVPHLNLRLNETRIQRLTLIHFQWDCFLLFYCTHKIFWLTLIKMF